MKLSEHFSEKILIAILLLYELINNLLIDWLLINAIEIPNAIILPNSITGFISPKVSDKNATAVVKAAKKHGANICS